MATSTHSPPSACFLHPFQIFFHYGMLQGIEYSSLYYIRTLFNYFIYSNVYVNPKLLNYSSFPFSKHSFFLFLFLKVFIIVDLQCSINFCVQQIDPVIHMNVHFFSHYPPLCSITSDQIQFSVLYRSISLLIHSKCSSLHLLTPNSQSISLLPPPL